MLPILCNLTINSDFEEITNSNACFAPLVSSFTVNVWQLIHNITFIVLKKIRITFIGVLVTNKNLNGLYIYIERGYYMAVRG